MNVNDADIAWTFLSEAGYLRTDSVEEASDESTTKGKCCVCTVYRDFCIIIWPMETNVKFSSVKELRILLYIFFSAWFVLPFFHILLCTVLWKYLRLFVLFHPYVHPCLLQADVILAVTCAIRENAERKIWSRLDYFRSLKRKRSRHRPPLKVGLLGIYCH